MREHRVFRPYWAAELKDKSVAILTGRPGKSGFECIIARRGDWLQREFGVQGIPARQMFLDAQLHDLPLTHTAVATCCTPQIANALQLVDASIYVSGFRVRHGQLQLAPVEFYVGASKTPTLMLPYYYHKPGSDLSQLIRVFIKSIEKRCGNYARDKNDAARDPATSYANLPMETIACDVASGHITISGTRGGDLLVDTAWEGVTGDPLIQTSTYSNGSEFTLGGSCLVRYMPTKKRMRISCGAEASGHLFTNADNDPNAVESIPLGATGEL